MNIYEYISFSVSDELTEALVFGNVLSLVELRVGGCGGSTGGSCVGPTGGSCRPDTQQTEELQHHQVHNLLLLRWLERARERTRVRERRREREREIARESARARERERERTRVRERRRERERELLAPCRNTVYVQTKVYLSLIINFNFICDTVCSQQLQTADTDR